MLNELKEICKHFHLNELEYCILRLPSPNDLFKKDIDILIKDVEVKNFHNILIAQNFEYFQEELPSHHHYRRGKLHLDLAVSLSYGKNKEYFASLGYAVLERRIFKDDMYFASDIDEFITLLLHCLFDKRDFNRHSAKIFQLIDIIGEKKCIKEMSKIFHLTK